MMFLKRYIFFLLCLPCLAQAKNITVSRLTCEMQEGLVLVEAYPRLGWTMESPENGTRQTAYEIEIREGPIFAKPVDTDSWSEVSPI